MFSESYRQQQQALHDAGGYGIGGNPAANYPSILKKLTGAFQCKSVLDYGAGSNLILKPTFDGLTYTPYDIIESLWHEPEPHDFVVCVDVLEHVEPVFLHDVMDHIARLTEKVMFASIHTGPALKTLPDGRNAHLTQEPMEWWFNKFASRFDIQQLMKVSAQEFFVIGTGNARTSN